MPVVLLPIKLNLTKLFLNKLFKVLVEAAAKSKVKVVK